MTYAIPLFERLLIESHSLCNRVCWFCPRTYDRSGVYLDERGRARSRRMATATVLALLDQARELGFRGPVGFHHYSEPLLDERVVGFADAASERGMQPYLHTNGDALRHDDRLCAEVGRAFHRIVVGLYDHRNDAEREEAERSWRARLPGIGLEFSAIGVEGSLGGRSAGVPKALVPTDRRFATPDVTFAGGPCSRPLLRLIIRYDGKMCQCCEDAGAAFDLGNVHRASLAELWFSERHTALIEALLSGERDRFALCAQCPQFPTGPAPDGRRIRMARRRSGRARTGAG
jgi:radical SAM protein with 4Fe4S-binding SPASM domain